MRTIDSLPARPLNAEELRELERSDQFDRVVPMLEIVCDRREIMQLVLEREGRFLALHFETISDRWELVETGASFSDAHLALNEVLGRYNEETVLAPSSRSIGC